MSLEIGDMKGEKEFGDVKIENIAETDDASTSSEVRVTEMR